MPFQNDILGGASGQGGDYEIEGSSLWSYSDSSSLYKNFPGPASPGGGSFSSNQKMTMSCWIKLGPAADFYTDTTHIPYRCICGWGGSGGGFNIGLHMQDYNPPSGGSDVALAIKNADSGGSQYFQAISEALLRDPNAWYHIVVQIDSTSSPGSNRLRAWVNNVQIETWSQSSFPSSGQQMYINGNYFQGFRVGSGAWTGGASSYWDGYIAELHYLDGETKIPTDFAEEDLITGQWKPIEYDGTYGNNGGYWKLDSSVMANTFTDSTESFKSLYFDGTNDYVQCEIPLQGGTNSAFSIAFWIYFNEFTGQVFSQYADASSAGRFTLTPSGSSGSAKVRMDISGGATSVDTATNLSVGTWYHMVLTRDGGDYQWYVNGSTSGSAVSGGNTDQLYNGQAWINARYSNPGYCSVRMAQFATWNVELSSSDVTGLYDSGNKIANWKTSYSSGMKCYYTFGNSIVPATSGLGLGMNVDTITRTWDHSGQDNWGTNYNFAKGPEKGHPIIVLGDTANSRAYKKVGQSSIKFDGSGDYLTVPNSADWDMGTGSFTVECWVRFDAVGNIDTIIERDYAVNQRALYIAKQANNTILACTGSGTGSISCITSSSTVSATTWYHIAYVRDGTDFELFIDGTSVGTDTDAATMYDSDEQLIIGMHRESGSISDPFGGYMDEIRISNVARYTSNFTPSTSPFVTDANTKLLIHSDFGGGLGGDSSGNGHDLLGTNITADRAVKDSPTNNFCVINYLCYPRQGNNTYQHYRQLEGNLQTKHLSGAATSWYTATMAIAGGTGKWYWEMMDIRAFDVDNGTYPVVWGHGLTPITFANDTKGRSSRNNDMGTTYQWKFDKSNANVGTSGAYTGSNSSENKRVPSDQGMFKFCYDSDAGKFYWGGEIGWTTSTSTNTLDTSAEPTSTNFLWGPGLGVGDIGQYVVLPTFRQARSGDTEALLGYHSYNFGQDSSFQGKTTANGYTDANGYGDFHYAVPEGYKALCSQNMDDPAIQKSTEAFNTKKYDGNSSTNVITGVGFRPDLVWTKSYTQSNYNHWYDSLRGPNLAIYSNESDSTYTDTDALMSFDADGFTLGGESGLNSTSQSYISWNFKTTGGEAQAVTYPVTVAASKLVIGGESQVTVNMREGSTYTFDTSDSSLSGHNFKFATAADAAGSTEYTTGVTESGTPGNAGAKTVIVVASSAPQLYYYCSNHASMGGQANTNTTSGSSNFDGNNPTIVTANVDAGFSIVRYDGTGASSGTTMGHGLSIAPELIIVKRLNANVDWGVGGDPLQANPTTWTAYLNLNDGGATGASNSFWRDKKPTASVFECGNDGATNTSGGEYIAYCWHHVDGFSQIGGFEGWGNSYRQTSSSTFGLGSGGPFIPTTFQPAFVMIKNTGASGAWMVKDNVRVRRHNIADGTLYPSKTDNQTTGSAQYIDLVSNGFKMRGDSTEMNGNTQMYMYLALADFPFKYTRAR